MAAVVPEPPLAVGTLSGAAGARPPPTHLSQMWDRTDLRRLRTPAHVARICHLHISRLEFLRPLPQNPDHIFLNVRMRRHTKFRKSLRTDKIAVPVGAGVHEVPLDAAFTLHYSHDVVRPSRNALQITIGRRKKRTRQPKAICSVLLPLEDATQMSLAHTVVINAPSNQRGRPTPICRMSIKLSSVAANEDYRRQSQVLSTDARDELYGASDEDVDMDGMDLEGGAARPPPAKEVASRSWVGSNNIKSRLSSFLLRRRRGHPEHEPSRESLDEELVRESNEIVVDVSDGNFDDESDEELEDDPQARAMLHADRDEELSLDESDDMMMRMSDPSSKSESELSDDEWTGWPIKPQEIASPTGSL